MKITPAILSASLLLGMSSSLLPSARADVSTPETKEQRDSRMAWWREAKFGLFIHWGVYSVPAGFYKGKPVHSVGEWIMNNAKIPMADYQAFAKDFNPVKFDADQWVTVAKDAGVKYIVITSKHHDGFAMYPTKVNKWNIHDASAFPRDPLQELAAACRKQGIKFGFYYSQAQDWNNGGSANGGKWDSGQKRSMDDYIDNVAVPQLREILSNYGPDIPAVLWWDTPIDIDKTRAEKLFKVVQELKPNIITNNRLGGGIGGDTETPEQFIPAQGFPGRDWETCMTMNDTWGFKSDDTHWKTPLALIRHLCDITSKGGNFLLNVGPTSEGLIPQPSIERLHAVGMWLNTNGEAIYGTTPSPFPNRSFVPWGRATQRAGKLYLHVFNWPKDGKLFVPISNRPARAGLLASPKETLPISVEDGKGVTITVPPNAPDPIASVVVLDISEPVTPLAPPPTP